MRDIIKKLMSASAQNLLVIGDVMLDEYLIGSVDRISPEAPVPVFCQKRHEEALGGAANVAVNCRALGCSVKMIGLIGHDDREGRRIADLLDAQGVSVEALVRSSDRITTHKKRIVAQQQQLLRIDVEEACSLSAQERSDLQAAMSKNIQVGDMAPRGILLSDYAKGVIDRGIVTFVLKKARAIGAFVIVDPKGPDFEKYRGVDFIKPNRKEFYQMVDAYGLSREDSIVDNARRICAKLEIKGLIITLGDKGMQFISHEELLTLPAYAREVYDVTGAGDTVLAVLSVCLAHGLEMSKSLQIANLAASVTVAHHKTHTVSFSELLESNQIGQSSPTKVFGSDWARLKQVLSAGSSGKIVFTNGCFDLLHSGHIYLLEEAKKRGDLLVVALNTDESIQGLKGASRPVKPLAERVRVLASIGVVDYVVSFDEETPYKLIDYLRPDVLIKGGDYAVESLVGYDLIRSYGGEVEVVAYQEGRSTTGFIERFV